MRRSSTAAAILVASLTLTTGLTACGSDDDGDSAGSVPAADTAGAATSDPSAVTSSAPASTPPASTPPASTPPASSAPVSSAPGSPAPASTAPASTAPASTAPDSTNPAEGRAAAALLTTADLPGWTAAPEDAGGGGLTLDAPECADLQALDDDPALQDDATADFISPDAGTQLRESVTVGDPAAVQRAFDVMAAPTFPACLQAALTTVLQRPGLLPEGAQLAPIVLAPVPVDLGEASVAYAGDVTLTGGATTATLKLRVVGIHQPGSLALLLAITAPLGTAPDLAAVESAAAAKLQAAAG